MIFDATHAYSSRAARATAAAATGAFVPVLARAAVAVGVAGLFIETHQDPDRAPSDGPNMVPLAQFEGLMRELMAFDAVVKPRACVIPDVAQRRSGTQGDDAVGPGYSLARIPG